MTLRSQQVKESALSDLLDFVDQECTLTNDLLFSRDVLNQMSNQQHKNGEELDGKFRQVRTFTPQMDKCRACEKNHDLEKCKAIRDKCRWLMKQRLCFRCYGFSHVVKRNIRLDCMSIVQPNMKTRKLKTKQAPMELPNKLEISRTTVLVRQIHQRDPSACTSFQRSCDIQAQWPT